MKTFEEPKMDVVKFNVENVIANSEFEGTPSSDEEI